MKKNLLTIILTIIIISSMWFYSSDTSSAAPVSVELIDIKEKNIYDYINAKGKIKEGNKKDVYTKNTAKVKDVHIETGDYVNAGDIIIELEPIFENNESMMYGIDTKEILDVFKDYGVNIELPTSDVGDTVKLEGNTVVSPIDGVVTEVNVRTGDNVTAINKLASISDLSDLYVEAMIPEAYSANIEEGQYVKISADAFGAKEFGGKISKIKPIAKQTISLSGTGDTFVEAIIELDRVEQILRPELTVNAKITAKAVENAMTVPYECIRQDENNREYVFVEKAGKATLRHIATGYELENEVEVKSGLFKGEKIVLNPPENLSDGDEIKKAE